MTARAETAAIVALLRRTKPRWNRVAELVENAGSALALLSGDDAEPERLFDAPLPSDEADLKSIEAEIEEWDREGMRVVSVLESDYPTNLRTVHDRPPILFVRGELEPRDERSVAVVGTRRPTDDGLDNARAMATRLVEEGYVVASGLATGIDTAAHTASMDAGGRTIAVIGTGLRRSYPKENEQLQHRLGHEYAVVSQFWPDQPPGRHTFPMRNAVMSGLARATVVIEASDTSGARTQARLALSHHRPVFLLKSLLCHDWAQAYAVRPGVYVVEAADEVVSRLERLYSEDLALAP